MSASRRLLVWGLARGIRKAVAHGQVTAIRVAFDRRFEHHDVEWRRDVWQEAAEKATR